MTENQYKHINLSYLHSVSEGNKDLIKELIEIYISQIPEFIELFNQHLKQGNWTLLGSVAHKAKSSVAVMGLNDLSEMLKTLEILAKEGKNTNQYTTYIREFEIITTESVKELKQYLEKL